MPKTMIVTGASQGIGAGVTKALTDRGYNVVANARKITESALSPGERAASVDRNIRGASTAAKIATTATSRCGSIDGVVNNAGIFISKRSTDYTVDDIEQSSETILLAFIRVTQLAVKRMLSQKTGRSVKCITSAMVNHPSAGPPASVAMLTKDGLEAMTRSLAMEYSKNNIGFNGGVGNRGYPDARTIRTGISRACGLRG